MSHRVVEIGNPSYLRAEPGHIVIEQGGAVVGRIPVEDLGVLILDGAGTALTHEALVRLAQGEVSVVLCDEKHLPCALSLPLEGHSVHAKVLRAQVEVAEPTKKRLWQTLVRGKIRNQAEVVRRLKGDRRSMQQLVAMSTMVRSGDPDNLEGQAARFYWPLLFGNGFLRDREAAGINACLNYGYAVVRATVARALVGTGLHPSLGVHHRNAYNAFALADDVMEPLRPLVDLKVARLAQTWEDGAGLPDELTPALKRELLTILVERLEFAGKTTSFPTAIPLFAAYFKQALCRERIKLTVPEFATGADTESCGSW